MQSEIKAEYFTYLNIPHIYINNTNNSLDDFTKCQVLPILPLLTMTPLILDHQFLILAQNPRVI